LIEDEINENKEKPGAPCVLHKSQKRCVFLGWLFEAFVISCSLVVIIKNTRHEK
jgi:hypothetical protein